MPQNSTQPTAEDLLRGKELAIGQISWMRGYTLQLLESVPHELWYQVPTGCQTHIAWQVGHLAVAQYGLMMFRQRGREPDDLELIPSWLRKQFGKGSVPSQISPDVASPVELLDRLAAVHSASLEIAANQSVEQLAEPIEAPYAVYANKLGALLFAPYTKVSMLVKSDS